MWWVKAVASDVSSFKLKKKYIDLRIFIDDGSCPRRLVVLGPELASGVFGDHSPASLHAMKKADKGGYGAVLDDAARRLRLFEGLMELHWRPAPSDPAPVLTVVRLQAPRASRDGPALLAAARALLGQRALAAPPAVGPTSVSPRPSRDSPHLG